MTSMVLLACDNKDDIDSFLILDVAEYNDKIIKGRQDNQQWVETPYLIINQLFGPRYNSEGHQTFILEQYENDNDNSLTVIVTQEGLLDDSVAGEKRILEFKFENEVWTIIKMTLGMKCHEYRGGHTNYSGDVCS
jgi:hypothetical protein